MKCFWFQGAPSRRIVWGCQNRVNRSFGEPRDSFPVAEQAWLDGGRLKPTETMIWSLAASFQQSTGSPNTVMIRQPINVPRTVPPLPGVAERVVTGAVEQPHDRHERAPPDVGMQVVEGDS